MKGRMVFGLFMLVLYLSVISATTITKEEIKEKLKTIEIEDFEIHFGDYEKNVIVIGKSPNYYKAVGFKNGDLDGYEICYNDEWNVRYSKDLDSIIRTDYNKFFNFLKGVFGFEAPCEKMFNKKWLDMTPNPLFFDGLRSNGPELYFEFEEGNFEGRDTIKVTGASYKTKESPKGTYPARYFERHYDKNTLIEIVYMEFSCTPENPSCDPNRIIENNDILNQGIQESDFNIPELGNPTRTCEKDIEKVLNLTSEINEIQEILFVVQGLTEEERVDKMTKEMRKLTEEEYNRLILLKKQLGEAECKKPNEKDICTYSQYIEGAFMECEFDWGGVVVK